MEWNGSKRWNLNILEINFFLLLFLMRFQPCNVYIAQNLNIFEFFLFVGVFVFEFRFLQFGMVFFILKWISFVTVGCKNWLWFDFWRFSFEMFFQQNIEHDICVFTFVVVFGFLCVWCVWVFILKWKLIIEIVESYGSCALYNLVGCQNCVEIYLVACLRLSFYFFHVKNVSV